MKLYEKILSKFWFNLGTIISIILGIFYPIIFGCNFSYINTIFVLVINIVSVVLINMSISFLKKNQGIDAAINYRNQAKYNFCGIKIMLFLVIICFVLPFVVFDKENIIRDIAISMYVNGFVIPLLLLFFYISLDAIKEDRKEQNPILCCLKGFLSMFILFFEKDQNNKRPIVKGVVGALFIMFLIFIVLKLKIMPIFT